MHNFRQRQSRKSTHLHGAHCAPASLSPVKTRVIQGQAEFEAGVRKQSTHVVAGKRSSVRQGERINARGQKEGEATRERGTARRGLYLFQRGL
jgi:hypothetical protein